MKKKMTKKLFVVMVALTALTACSDSTISEVESGVIDPTITRDINSAELTDANGQKVSSVSSNFGTYYLDIKSDGMWYIETPGNMEFTPTKMYGKGSARVPVLIGNNWAEARQLSYKVNFLDENGQPLNAGTRAEGDNTQTLSQDALLSLERFKKVVSSNVFVGYGFNPSKNAVPELCTGIQIFDMEAINENDTLIKHDFVPLTDEDYYYHTSDSMLDKVIAVKGKFGGNFNVVKLGVGADVSVRKASTTGQIVVHKSLTRSMYSREIAWEKAWFNDSNYSPGYRYYKNLFIKEFTAAGDDADKKKAAADDFFRIVGTHVITKCFLGCELNYRMTVNTNSAKNLTDVKAALDFKWQQQIKDTAKVDSATKAKIMQLMKDSTKLKNVLFKGDVQYTNDQFDAATSTKAKVKARGNDIQLVNILATGGSLNCTDLAQWMLGTEPEKATMVGILVHPIYDIFDDSDSNPNESKARAYLKEIIGKNYPLNEDAYGNLLDIDLSDLE